MRDFDYKKIRQYVYYCHYSRGCHDYFIVSVHLHKRGKDIGGGKKRQPYAITSQLIGGGLHQVGYASPRSHENSNLPGKNNAEQ